ncbi:MAG: hypothetical protein H7Z10_01125 [Gemmatimonadaceae bacterium]|nr:hypothetical protein [Acetobacteraceae bacterium]
MFGIEGVVDGRHTHACRTERKTYRIFVVQLMRVITREPFAISVSVQCVALPHPRAIDGATQTEVRPGRYARSLTRLQAGQRGSPATERLLAWQIQFS